MTADQTNKLIDLLGSDQTFELGVSLITTETYMRDAKICFKNGKEQDGKVYLSLEEYVLCSFQYAFGGTVIARYQYTDIRKICKKDT